MCNVPFCAGPPYVLRAKLLSKATSIPAVGIASDTVIESNHIYVMAPGVRLSLVDEKLKAEPRRTRRGAGKGVGIE